MKQLIHRTLLLSVGVACLASTSAWAAPQRVTYAVTNDELALHQPEARDVLTWVGRHVRPSFAPLGAGTVHVERSAFSSGAVARMSDPSPPGKLPDSGYPGEQYKVENTLPDGTYQSWEFRWVEPSSGHGGGWEMTGYQFKRGNDPVEIQ
ncbi:hypothetical protein LMF57_01335 [Stenotrophomonas sp. SI-NJAU-1]|uniref:hypothetical protein n=1 Tax=Stenotrophomonas TaxID=40323 RepID=UPI000B6CC962|nr:MULTISPECIES: hypothetical protein [Stenotrophomonas]MBO1746609.1 hypothetical protein [Stenotrophomonas indicatrix]OUL11536.1 hypothetical protein B0X78_13110 [bacterium AM6]QGL61987.1 hypothetical protein FEO87_01420 [Stenotrophomonas maltophilia]UEX18526.1 hypothetical protein LMF57_01335 [Stenotrophomonas sp. SI-NJAU-1]